MRKAWAVPTAAEASIDGQASLVLFGTAGEQKLVRSSCMRSRMSMWSAAWHKSCIFEPLEVHSSAQRMARCS